MQTIHTVLNKSIEFLSQKGICHPRRHAEELIADVLGLKRLQIYLDFERPLNKEELARCRAFLIRRAKGEPSQYIKGYVNFYDCKIKVGPKVLIPRQETEILVDKIAHILGKENLSGKSLWDVCCGSGCIGIAIKKKFPELNVVLSDISLEALAIAEENAKQNDVELTLLQGNLLEPFSGQKTNYFVCNPPYISEAEYLNLDKEVKEFEPKLALTAANNGLEFYQRLSKELQYYLFSTSKVWFEIGHTQGKYIEELFSSSIWKKREKMLDWSGKDRFFFLEIE